MAVIGFGVRVLFRGFRVGFCLVVAIVVVVAVDVDVDVDVDEDDVRVGRPAKISPRCMQRDMGPLFKAPL